jgi:hypothetical protein
VKKQVVLPHYCDWIKEEYFYLQSQLEEFDKKALQIKQWSVTIALAGIGTAYWKGVPALLLLSSISAALFWILETQWKLFQQAHVGRIKCIERYMRFPAQELAPLQVNSYWNRHYNMFYKKWREFVRIGFWRGVLVPHLVIAIVGVLLFFLVPPAIKSEPTNSNELKSAHANRPFELGASGSIVCTTVQGYPWVTSRIGTSGI